MAVLLAEALYQLGRRAEAEQFADLGLALSSSEDIATQACGRAVKAKLLAANDELESAERLVDEAVGLSAATDDLFMQGQVFLGQADVCRRAKRGGAARHALLAAVDVSERKGNVVTARAAQALLADLEEDTPELL